MSGWEVRHHLEGVRVGDKVGLVRWPQGKPYGRVLAVDHDVDLVWIKWKDEEAEDCRVIGEIEVWKKVK